jgi:hypothetical protein
VGIQVSGNPDSFRGLRRGIYRIRAKTGAVEDIASTDTNDSQKNTHGSGFGIKAINPSRP